MPWKPKKSILAMGALRVEHVLHEEGAPEILPGAIRDVIRNAMEDGTDLKHAASPISIEGTLPHWAPILEAQCGITAEDIRLAKKLDQRPHVRRWLLRFGHKNWPHTRLRLYEIIAELLNAETPLVTRDQQIDPQLVPRMQDTYTAWETEVRRRPKMIRRSNSRGYDRDDPNQRYDGQAATEAKFRFDTNLDPLSFHTESSTPWLIPSRIVTWPDRKHVISFDELNKRWRAELKQMHKAVKKQATTRWRKARFQAMQNKVPKHQLPERPHVPYPQGRWSPYYVKGDLMEWMLYQRPMLGKVLKHMTPEQAREKAVKELLEIIEALNGAAHGDKRAEFVLRKKRTRWFGKLGAAWDESQRIRWRRWASIEVEVEEGITERLPVWDVPRPWTELERFKFQLRRKMINDIRIPKGQAWFPMSALPPEQQALFNQIVMDECIAKNREPHMTHIEVTKIVNGQEVRDYSLVEPRWAIEAYYDIRLDPDLEAECEESHLEGQCPTCHGLEQRPQAITGPHIEVWDHPETQPVPTCGANLVLLPSEDQVGPVRPACGQPRKPGHAYCADHMARATPSLWPWS
ncbi:MAG: hypothetical protein GWN58_31785 [Anaerolineae bacterium]|nr:hypothetical protein [Anaerolineae bacterium]